MVAYRFCRPDDIPELVIAVNRCFDVHFGDPGFTVEGFRREMREVQLWPSNCMLARAGDDAVAVVLGTKRPREVLVRRIGVAPGFQRQGHGRHLLDSLGHKLAVLGPPRLIAEVPLALADARAFFAGAGWREETRLGDFVRAAGQGAASAPAAPLPPCRDVTLADLEAQQLIGGDEKLAWERQRESLRAAPDLRGVALDGGGGIAAWALFRPAAGGGAEVLRLGFPAGDAPAWLAPLAAAVQAAMSGALLPGALTLYRLGPGELPDAALGAAGFSPTDAFVRFATVAEAA